VGDVLVTGAAGFIGSALADRLLAEGHRVIGVDDLSTGRIANLAEARGYGKQFTFENVDIRSDVLPAVLEKHRPEVVMHLAAQVSVTTSMREPLRDVGINVLGLVNLLEAAAAMGTRKIVFASSGGTLYGQQRILPIKETARRGSRPESVYGASKKVAEYYLNIYRRDRGVDYTILALANVYGPRQDPHGEAGVVAIFSRRMLAGEQPVIFGDGEQTRDYVFVDDVVHAFSLAAPAGRASGELLNIGTAREASVNEVLRLLAKPAGYRGKPKFAPERPGELRRSALDWSLAGKKLGWEPWTSLEKGLATTFEWFHERTGRGQRGGQPQ
jgi:UDP-glucose 4-epimerase